MVTLVVCIWCVPSICTCRSFPRSEYEAFVRIVVSEAEQHVFPHPLGSQSAVASSPFRTEPARQAHRRAHSRRRRHLQMGFFAEAGPVQILVSNHLIPDDMVFHQEMFRVMKLQMAR